MGKRAKKSIYHRRDWSLVLRLPIAVGFLLALWAGVHLAAGRAIIAPERLTGALVARANALLGEGVALDVGAVGVTLLDGQIPRVLLRDVRLKGPDGAELVQLPEVRARLSLAGLFEGRIALTRLTLAGGNGTLRRDAEGRFGLRLGTAQTAPPGSLADVLSLVDLAFARPELEGLERIVIEDLRLTFEDEKTGQGWQAEEGEITLRNLDGRRSLSAAFALSGEADAAPGRVVVSAASQQGASWLTLGGSVDGVQTADIARQFPGLGWLSAADAPISAAFRAQIEPDGGLGRLDGSLRLGQGEIRPQGGGREIAFDEAGLYFSYHPEDQRIEFAEIRAVTQEASLAGRGQALLGAPDPDTRLPSEMVLQLSLTDILLDPADTLAEPVRMPEGVADLRLTLAPFVLDIGQVALFDEARALRAKGRVAAVPGGWNVALDLAVDEIELGPALALWPVKLAGRTREWVGRNVSAGRLTDFWAGLRLKPDTPPQAALGFAFSDAAFSVMGTMPPVQSASGRGALSGGRFALALEEGAITAPDGGAIRLDGSVLVVPDVRQRPAQGEVTLESEGTIASTLSLIDLPPLQVMTKAGRPTDLAEGRARVQTRLGLPLRRGLTAADVDYAFDGRLTGVRSEVLVPGRTLRAAELSLSGDRSGLSIAGAGQIGMAGFDAVWSREAGPDAGGGSRVEGTVTLDRAFLDEFDIALPRGAVAGRGAGQISIDLPRGAPPRFRLVSDLNRLSLRLDALGWSKGPAETGRLEVEGQLGSPPDIDRIALETSSLSFEGAIGFGEGGGSYVARLDPVSVGGWFEGRAVLTGRGPGRPPRIEATGGRVDLRRAAFGRGGGGGGGQLSEPVPIVLSLDRLTVSESIALAPMRAELSAGGGGLSGAFSGRLGGAAPLSGQLSPAANGTQVNITAADAGAVIRAMGLVKGANGGTLSLDLTPRGGGPGRYEGTFRVDGLRVRDAPALAELLSAVSVVGLLEQMDGQGIPFGRVSGSFLLDPARLTLREASAVGPSLGISMAGIYDFASSMLDMQGTISPLYLINGIGALFSRQGEGVFGFNYRMSGPVSQPVVRVNPLSILTPGMFREIFRAPPSGAER